MDSERKPRRHRADARLERARTLGEPGEALAIFALEITRLAFAEAQTRHRGRAA